jgi:hypothetical protein
VFVRGWSALALALVAPGCLRATTHVCVTDADCGNGGRCEPSGFCSFTDPACDGGRRYGDGAGGLAGVCLGDEPGGPDAATDAPPTDRDGDGVFDGTDNCIDVRNADQHDEDGDTVGDVCDNCPHLENLDQANTGEMFTGGQIDGAGDACDPNPIEGGNEIVFFDPFTAPLDDTWTSFGGGTWTVSGDALHVDARGLNARLARPAPSPGTQVITTRATAGGISNGPGAYNGLGAAARIGQAGGGGIGCLASYTNKFEVATMLIELAAGQVRAVGPLSQPTFVDVPWVVSYAATLASQGPDVCTVNPPGGAEPPISAGNTSTATSTIGLSAINVPATFEYIVAISD